MENVLQGYAESTFGRTTYSGPIYCSDCYACLPLSRRSSLQAVLLYHYHSCDGCKRTIGGKPGRADLTTQQASQPQQATHHSDPQTLSSALSVPARTLLDHAMSTSGTVPDVAGQSLATSTLLALMARAAGDESRLHGYLHHIHSVPVTAR